jgi:hypothetical protein
MLLGADPSADHFLVSLSSMPLSIQNGQLGSRPHQTECAESGRGQPENFDSFPNLIPAFQQFASAEQKAYTLFSHMRKTE